MKSLDCNRRRFVQGLISAGAASLGARYARALPIGSAAPELSGKNFELTIDKLPVNFTGRSSVAFAVNGSVPGPTLRWNEGDNVRIAVTNRLNVPTSIHWHAMRVPSGMDGVPGLSFAGIAPGEQFVYEFPVRQNGTYWYHSHTGFQEQIGVSGAIIIEPRYVDPIRFDREYVIFLSDWTDTDPRAIFSNLKRTAIFITTINRHSQNSLHKHDQTVSPRRFLDT